MLFDMYHQPILTTTSQIIEYFISHSRIGTLTWFADIRSSTELTDIGLFPGVSPLVDIQVALLYKGLVAYLAGIWLDAIVDAEVHVKFILVIEMLPTMQATVEGFLVICTMHLHVVHEVDGCFKEFAAQAALKLPLV